jgi:hypothetical protein
MGCPSEVAIGDNLTFTVTTHSPTPPGAAADADSPPTYRVYEAETGTPIITGSMAKLDDADTTGFYSESIECSSANGFEDGKSYTIYVEAVMDAATFATSYGFRAVEPAAGGGARTILIAAVDAAGADVQGVRVRLTKGPQKPFADTDADGEAVLNVDDGTWTMAATIPGYSFTSATLDGVPVVNRQVVVSGDHALAIVMTAAELTASDPGSVTAYIYCLDEVGDPEEDVEIRLFLAVPPPGTTGLAFDSTERLVESGATGLAEFPGCMPASTVRYRRGTTGAWTQYTFAADASGNVQLPSIVGTP